LVGIALDLGVDVILELGRTWVNVTGDLYIATVVNGFVGACRLGVTPASSHDR
jgi:Na+/H+-dicarboxylate symporter